MCINCFKQTVTRKWRRCIFCRNSGTACLARVTVEPDSNVDLSVFIQPQNGAASAAAAEPRSSEGFIPRRVIVTNFIKHHRAKIEEIDNTIDRMIDQLHICRDRRNKHKEHLEELLAEQANFHTPAASAPTAAAATVVSAPTAAAATVVSASAAAASAIDNDDDDDNGNDNEGPIATYDNSAAAAAAATDDDDVTIASIEIITEHRNHAMQRVPNICTIHLRSGSDVKGVNKDPLRRHFRARGWTSREMKLTMKGTELDDDHKFMENARPTLELIVHFSSAEDSNDNPSSSPSLTSSGAIRHISTRVIGATTVPARPIAASRRRRRADRVPQPIISCRRSCRRQ